MATEYRYQIESRVCTAYYQTITAEDEEDAKRQVLRSWKNLEDVDPENVEFVSIERIGEVK